MSSSVQPLEPLLPERETTMRMRPQPPAEIMNEATRHLCVGAYVDREYRTEVLRNVYFDGSRRLAPSYGFVLPPVLVHARRAWLFDMAEQVVVAALAIGALVIDSFSLAPAITLLVSWHLVRHLARLGPAFARFLAGRTHPEEHERMRAKAVVLGLALVGSWGALLLLLYLTRGATRLTELRSFALWGRTGALVALFAVVAAWFAFRRQCAVDRLRSGAREPGWRGNRRLVNLHHDGQRPVTVYSGFRPFVGSGLEWRTWSFAQLLVPKSDQKPVDDENPDFTTATLVGHVKEHIQDLAFEPDPERRLPDLTVRDHIFVVGTHANDVPEHPEPDDFLRVMSDTTGPIRHYLACQVPSWDGEVVTTVYVHTSLQGRTLYLEFSTWALPPTVDEFHVVDRVGGTGPRAHIRSLASTAWALPEKLVPSRQNLLILTRAVGSTVSGERWPLLQRRGIDIGATVSVRELGAEVVTDKVVGLTMTTDINYFQYRDVVKHSKVIERRLLDTILDFLREHGVDTAEYEQRTITILNAGIVHTGTGNVNFQGVMGEGGTYNAGQTPGGEG